MPKVIISLMMIVSGFFTGTVFPQYLTITPVGEYGKGNSSGYEDVFIMDKYAYCASGEVGLDIIDIGNPSNFKKIGNYNTSGWAEGVYVNGKYAYVADGSDGLQVIDVSRPSAPVRVGNYDRGKITGVCVSGNYAYVASVGYGLQIIDISDPTSPAKVGYYYTRGDPVTVFLKGKYAFLVDGSYHAGNVSHTGDTGRILGTVETSLTVLDVSDPSAITVKGRYATNGEVYQVYVSGNYAYLVGGGFWFRGLEVIDISNLSAPTLVGHYSIGEIFNGVWASGNYAYIAAGVDGLLVLDVSDPSTPTKVGSFDTRGEARGVYVGGNYAYVADGSAGLKALDVSDSSTPIPGGRYDPPESMGAHRISVNGNYAYTVGDYNYKHGNLKIFNIADSSSPTAVGSYDMATNPKAVYVSGNFAYVSTGYDGLLVLDVSDPSAPALAGKYEAPAWTWLTDVYVSGDYAYVVAGDQGLLVLDVSDPSAPALTGSYVTREWPHGVYVNGNYAYVVFTSGGLHVLDVSDPSAPALAGKCDVPNLAWSTDVYVSGSYAYVVIGNSGLAVLDVSDPAVPALRGRYNAADWAVASDVKVSGNYAYMAFGNDGLHVLDVSDPSAPALAARFHTQTPAKGVDVRDNYIYLAAEKLLILKTGTTEIQPRIKLSRTTMIFAADHSGAATGSQSFFISNSSGGNLDWSTSIDSNWLSRSPASGTGNGKVFVSVDPRNLSPGAYKGTIRVSDPFADNSPQTVTVTLTVYPGGQTSGPFGEFTTPVDGAIVSGSVPLAGWALDDTAVRSVQLFREDGNSLVYIGNAVFVEGARPDVEQDYPGYPNNYRAGWGYVLLTHFFPGGDGMYSIHALAADTEGHLVTLGTRTITVDNANAVKPFGTIDTPAQGGTAAGSRYVNFGWALTPLPNTIPTDGSTIRVWVDGTPLGNPVYNHYRQDIADLFPGHNNSSGAVGYFYLDTKQYENGVHTIQWTVTDDAGNTGVIGSRYFSILNSDNHGQQSSVNDHRLLIEKNPVQIPVDFSYTGPIRVKKGYNQNIQPREIFPGNNGTINIESSELEPLEIHLSGDGHYDYSYAGYLAAGNRLKSLPIGSRLDKKNGIFYWQPGAGFVGRYELVFIETNFNGNKIGKNIAVTIIPKFSK